MKKTLLLMLIAIGVINYSQGYDLYGLYNITDGTNSPSRLYTSGFSPISPVTYNQGPSCSINSICPGGYSVVFDGNRNKLYPYNGGGVLSVASNGNYYCAQIDSDPPAISISGWPNTKTPNTTTRLNVYKYNPLKDLRITVQENTLKIRKIKVIIGSKSGEINYIDGTISGPNGTSSFPTTTTGYVTLGYTGIMTQIFGMDVNQNPWINILQDGRNYIKVIACDTSTDPQNFKSQADVNCRSIVADSSQCAGESQCNTNSGISNPLNVDNNGPKLIIQNDTAYGLSENASYLLVDGTTPDNMWKKRSLNVRLGTQDTFGGPTDTTTTVIPVQGGCDASLTCKFSTTTLNSKFNYCCFQ